MDEAEFGDLNHFLNQFPGTIRSRYFTEQLFEIAKAINTFHKHNILHLDIHSDWHQYGGTLNFIASNIKNKDI